MLQDTAKEHFWDMVARNSSDHQGGDRQKKTYEAITDDAIENVGAIEEERRERKVFCKATIKLYSTCLASGVIGQRVVPLQSMDSLGASTVVLEKLIGLQNTDCE